LPPFDPALVLQEEAFHCLVVSIFCEGVESTLKRFDSTCRKKNRSNRNGPTTGCSVQLGPGWPGVMSACTEHPDLIVFFFRCLWERLATSLPLSCRVAHPNCIHGLKRFGKNGDCCWTVPLIRERWALIAEYVLNTCPPEGVGRKKQVPTVKIGFTI
jgi:hypothetical protein